MNKYYNSRYMIKKLLGVMSVMATIIFVACSDQNVPSDNTQSDDSEMVEMKFTLTTETEIATRGYDSDGNFTPDGPGASQTISKGQEIDLLIIGVYLKHRDGSDPTLLTQYGYDYVVDTELKKKDNFNPIYYLALRDRNVEAGDLIVMYLGDTFKEKKSVNFTLRLMRNQEYIMAYWAQSIQTDAYDTSDLTKVTVNYEDALNNDETRDAFCKKDEFSVGPIQLTGENNSRTVILTRPFAQINVGTTGADYEANIKNNKEFKYSKITLTGVADKLNIVTDEISGNKEVVFDYNPIVAYVNYANYPYIEIPSADDLKNHDTGDSKNWKEEFLLVNLDDHSEGTHGELANALGFLKYKTDYPTIDDKGKANTETFKYLSMCYVLVPSSSSVDGEDKDYSSVLSSVKAEFSADRKSAVATIAPINVPVRRNWRTNILKGIGKVQTPDVATNVDLDVQVNLEPNYFDDYNHIKR